MAKTWYEYETESGNKLMNPRMNFRNMNRTGGINFPFNLTKPGDLYAEYKDIYSYKDSEIVVVGGDAHCHEGEELGKYQEGIAFFCEETNKEEIIEQIRRVG